MKIGSTIVNTISCFCVAGGLSVPVFAGDGGAGATECSYKQAQDSMLRFNNVMQELNLEIVKLQAAGKPIPESLRGKLTQMVDESTPLNVMMGEISSPESIQSSTAVDPAICQGYEGLIEAYGGNSAGVVQVHKNAKCDQGSLWTRYGEAMQAVTRAFQEQRITREDVDQFRVMDVQIGQYSTTNLGKACEILEEYESQVSAIQ